MRNLGLGFSFYSLLVLLILHSSCKKEEIPGPITEASEVNQFVWNAMNEWYFWQKDVSSLSDTYKSSDIKQWHENLMTYNNPEDLFESLLYQKGTTDRFSWIVDDYEELNNQFSGITTSYGFKFGLLLINGAPGFGYESSPDDIIAMVRYVFPGDNPARNAGLTRGSLIWGVNGETLTRANYVDLLYGLKSATYNIMEVKEDGLIYKSDKTFQLSSEVLHENPVHTTKVIELNSGQKVGYLKYNGFRHNYHRELVEAFSTFKAEGIEELVLDLRYNGGGSVLTAIYLSSLIHYYKDQTCIFLDYNQKNAERGWSAEFTNTIFILDEDYNNVGVVDDIPSLQLEKLYVLTSSGTASASEMVINALKPFIPITIVGETTYGKNVASLTLYDCNNGNYTKIECANPSHKYALQPITAKIFNSNGESDFTHGFQPDLPVREYAYLNQIKPFGDEEEVVLRAALQDICPSCYDQPVAINRSADNYFLREIVPSTKENQWTTEMYLPPKNFDLSGITTRIDIPKQ